MRKSAAAIACALATALAVSAPVAQAGNPRQCIKKAHKQHHGKDLKQALQRCKRA